MWNWSIKWHATNNNWKISKINNHLHNWWKIIIRIKSKTYVSFFLIENLHSFFKNQEIWNDKKILSVSLASVWNTSGASISKPWFISLSTQSLILFKCSKTVRTIFSHIWKKISRMANWAWISGLNQLNHIRLLTKTFLESQLQILKPHKRGFPSYLILYGKQ